MGPDLLDDYVHRCRVDGGSSASIFAVPTLLHRDTERRFGRRHRRPENGAVAVVFETETMSMKPMLSRAVMNQLKLICLPIQKRPGGIFPDRIGVGRAQNVDVTIPYQAISKYHAFFTIGDDHSVFLTDAGSRNGTFVRGRRLEPKVPCLLTDEDEIRFAQHPFVFRTANGLVELVLRLARSF